VHNPWVFHVFTGKGKLFTQISFLQLEIVVCDTSERQSEIEGEFKIVISVEGEMHEFTFERRL